MTDYARRLAHLRPSTIRELLKVTLQPEIISFAGGLPAPELFPVAEISEACRRVLAEEGHWTHPEGGMFLWVTCPPRVDTDELLQAAIGYKVMFVPGRDFFPDGSGGNFMRLHFSNAVPAKIEEGIARLAALCRMAAG